MRKATLRDAELLLQWRNDTTARQNSFHTEEIAFSEHSQWLKNALADPDVYIFILMKGETLLGQVRVHQKGQDAVISYSIAPEHRHQGYGAKMLALLEEWMTKRNTSCRFIGDVKKENIASIRVFESLGYTCVTEEDHYRYMKMIEPIGSEEKHMENMNTINNAEHKSAGGGTLLSKFFIRSAYPHSDAVAA